MQGKGIISKVIRIFDKGKFTHCAIAISDSEVIEANYDTKVAIRSFDPKKYKEIEVLDLGLNEHQRQKVYISAMEQLGKRYDYLSLMWYVIRKIFRLRGKNRLNNPNHVICSELVFIALDKSGALKDLGIEQGFNRGIDLTPNELYDLVKYISK